MVKVLWYIYNSNHIHTNEWISFLKRHVDFHWYSVPFIFKVHPHQRIRWPIKANHIYFLNLMVKNRNPTYVCVIIKMMLISHFLSSTYPHLLLMVCVTSCHWWSFSQYSTLAHHGKFIFVTFFFQPIFLFILTSFFLI